MAVGDTVTAIDGTATPDKEAALYEMSRKSWGDQVTIDVLRKDAKQSLTAPLVRTPPPGTPGAPPTTGAPPTPNAPPGHGAPPPGHGTTGAPRPRRPAPRPRSPRARVGHRHGLGHHEAALTRERSGHLRLARRQETANPRAATSRTAAHRSPFALSRLRERVGVRSAPASGRPPPHPARRPADLSPADGGEVTESN